MEQPKSKRAARAEATREHLLATAANVFADRGYHQTSVGAITSAANTAHGTFYLYFKNKEEIFAALVQSAVGDMYDRMFAGRLDGGGPARLRQALRNNLEGWVMYARLWRCLLEAVLTSPAIEAMWGEIRAGFINQLASRLAELQEQGKARAVDPVTTANAIGAMLEWTATTTFVLRMPPVGEATLDQTVDTIVDLCFHALSASSSVEKPS